MPQGDSEIWEWGNHPQMSEELIQGGGGQVSDGKCQGLSEGTAESFGGKC